MPASLQRRSDEPVNQHYFHNDLGFQSPGFFDTKFDMAHSREGDISFYSFDNTSNTDQSNTSVLSGYDLSASPTMSGAGMFFSGSRPTHIDPAAMWNNSAKANLSANVDMAASQNAHNLGTPNLGKILVDYRGPASRFYEQITPPSENDVEDAGTVQAKRADSGISHDMHNSRIPNIPSPSSSKSHGASKTRTMSGGDRPSKKARRESVTFDDDDDDDMMEGGEGGDKREKYREKNRVAAAKCRAKKKEHVDHLEETHRTQSVLNTALKQSEKSLRDELSFWRTQALQHTFCNCRPIQEYNMRKAQNLAAESILGNPHGKQSPSMRSMSSVSVASPVGKQCGIHPSRPQSVSGVGISSPVSMSKGTVDVPVQFPPHPPMGAPHRRNASASMMRSGPLSLLAEQELKNFVNDTAE